MSVNYLMAGAITSGILVSSPAATQTFFFGFTADGYMLAMLLSALAVWLTQEQKISKTKILLAILCICFSLASYQAYLSFALCLAICYFCLKLLANCFSPKQIWKWISAQAVVFSCGTALYYAMWKILMRIEQVKPTEYLGIDNVSFDLSVVKGGFARTIQSILLYFLEWNVFEHGWTLYAVLNVIFVFCALSAIAVVCKTGIYKNKLNFALFLVALAVMPFAVCILSFAADIGYGARMLFSMSLIYIFIAVLFENYFSSKSKNIFAVLLFVIVFNNSLIANISYYYMNRTYHASYAVAFDIVQRIHLLNTQTSKIAVIGDLTKEAALVEPPAARIHMQAELLERNLIFDEIHLINFINETFYGKFRKGTLKNPDRTEVTEMPCWPAKGCIKIIDGIIVIKLNDSKEKDYHAFYRNPGIQ